jgi:transposase
LQEALLERGYQVVILNPLLVKGYRVRNLRGRKTDKDDSLLIAQILLNGEYQGGNLRTELEEIFQLRELCRLRWDLAHTLGDLKKRVISILDKVFPEYDGFFADTFGKSSLALLSQMSSPEEIAGIDTAKLNKILTQASRNRLGKGKAEALKALAKKSIGIRWGREAFQLQIKMLLEQITLLEAQIKALEVHIAQIYKQLNLQLTTIPGVGVLTAATIIAEIGSIERFKKDRGRQLLAFAGLDPKIIESGTFKGKTKMSKRGSAYLRTAIFIASNCARQFHPFFAQVYDKQINKGKHHTVAVSHVANKMCQIIYANLRDNLPFRDFPN